MAPGLAGATAKSELAYRVEEAFSTAVRYVRVDRGCKITDKDPEAAYVMFECPADDKKVSRGSLEIFRTASGSREGVRIQITLTDEPHGAELRMVELFERKLREERGAPREAPRPAPAPPSRDAGTVP